MYITYIHRHKTYFFKWGESGRTDPINQSMLNKFEILYLYYTWSGSQYPEQTK